jgi:hypothetical protein
MQKEANSNHYQKQKSKREDKKKKEKLSKEKAYLDIKKFEQEAMA